VLRPAVAGAFKPEGISMKYSLIGRIAGVVVLTMGLAACVDMTEEVAVTSDTTAKATMTMVMGADIYAMMKSAPSKNEQGEQDKFCGKDGETLAENADGSATCTSISEGTFDQLKFDEGDSKAVFATVSPGVIRVSFPTKGMAGELGKDNSDPQTAAMMKQMFEGHFVTLRISGKQITDSNLTISDDKASAEIKIPFLDLIGGTAKLPEEIYAVVDTN
jgi:molybdopterin-binding protein